MHSNPAPRVDDELTKVAVASPELADDPVRRLLGGPSDPVRHLGPRHWFGLLGLVAAIAVAAFVMPPLITPAKPPAPRPAAAPLPSAAPFSAAPSSASQPGSPLAAAPDDPTSTAVSAAPPTHGVTRTPPAGARSEPAAPGSTTGPAPRPSGNTPGTFHSITVQAENGSLSEGAAAVDCGTCRSGARVRFVGRVDVHAMIPAPGTYAVTVVYEVDGSRTLDVSIDGRPPVASRTVTGRSWTTPLSLTLRAALPAGPIDIALYGDAGNAPDIDAVTIS